MNENENRYEMEELVPIVAQLAEKYTSKESSSVSYERAQQLMEAVLYCIAHSRTEDMSDNCGQAGKAGDMSDSCGRAGKTEDSSDSCGQPEQEDRQIREVHSPLTAAEAYRAGRENILKKLECTRTAYNSMAAAFEAYGNENYYETVIKGIPAFFLYYDVNYAPQETILTLDYPTILPIGERSGIDAIAQYVTWIACEQQFLGAFPDGYVREVLSGYCRGYAKQYFNICSIVLRHILKAALIGKSAQPVWTREEEERLYQKVRQYGKDGLRQVLTMLLQRLVSERYAGINGLYEYLYGDMDDFTEQLFVRSRYAGKQKESEKRTKFSR